MGEKDQVTGASGHRDRGGAFEAPSRYVSRGGEKLRHALDHFGLDVAGLVCADLGASTGGFTDCLLQAGAARVYAVDTAYGQLAWKLRNDPRVVVMERTNALHAEPTPGGVDLVVIDLGWTRQSLAIPAALRWLRAGGRIVTLIKPHYEIDRADFSRLARGGVLPDDEGEKIANAVVEMLRGAGHTVATLTRSPIRGGGKGGAGNAEWLALVTTRPS
ncbi:MAG: TlyA family RNA methyltransferase [Leptolyngbya sp. PLA2]|nr:TlyA family RNA methyltransferase [Leptolyngbya sp.]MCE7971561.1 TlyA family RNA methyltransferase [Leptolyngbya sp. PL-A2]MCZ7632594.1 hypothetical protein [Phycisphaerales bacterium]MDL1904950.1 TlyA family RNA methyltransferase [Synechococcales cyanobacterium CNB]GIK19849.1 MAG: hypothetical protein BroJett004_20130 [Planctomycetota bacterium]